MSGEQSRSAGSKAMNELTRRCLTLLAFATFLWGSAPLSVAAEEGQRTARVALQGYDPVAYFVDGHPVKGSSAFSFRFDDAVYYFASPEHQKMFAADPDRYAPQYSGYCAVALSIGRNFEADPQSWAISNGRLYVFAGEEGVSVFAEDSARIIAKADANWAALKAQH
jgi:YHS domain-containing protein